MSQPFAARNAHLSEPLLGDDSLKGRLANCAVDSGGRTSGGDGVRAIARIAAGRHA